MAQLTEGPRARAGASAQALLESACAAHERGDRSGAEKLYRDTLLVDPRSARALLGLGILLSETGRLDEAKACLEGCARVAAFPADALHALGLVQARLGDDEGAAGSFAAALRWDPKLVGACVNLGLALSRLERSGPALEALESALVLAPDDPQIWKHYALVLLDAGSVAKGLQAAERAAAGLEPAARAGLLGLASLCSGNYARAESELRRAHAAMPAAADVAASLGVALEKLGRIPAAIEHYRAWIEREPQALARHLLAQLMLAQGSFREAWPYYADRISLPERRARDARAVAASALEGKRVLVLTEQGVGDEIFFLRYIPVLREVARPSAVFYAPSPRLEGVLRRVAQLDGVAPGQAESWEGPRVMLGDLPAICGSGADLPPPLIVPALPGRVQHWRNVLRDFGPAPYLAVNWRAGQGRPAAGPWRWLSLLQVKEISPALLGRALRGWRGTVVSVQRLQTAMDLLDFQDATGKQVLDAARANDDVEDLLALLSAVDELAGVSSASVHLRAAAGLASRVLVAHPPEWRWMAAGDRSPWYPACSLYRQSASLDWSDALAALRRDLQI